VFRVHHDDPAFVAACPSAGTDSREIANPRLLIDDIRARAHKQMLGDVQTESGTVAYGLDKKPPEPHSVTRFPKLLRF